MPRIAVLGCGRIGRMHAENIAAHPRAELAGVFDVVASAADDVAGRLAVQNFPSAEAFGGTIQPFGGAVPAIEASWVPGAVLFGSPVP